MHIKWNNIFIYLNILLGNKFLINYIGDDLLKNNKNNEEDYIL